MMRRRAALFLLLLLGVLAAAWTVAGGSRERGHAIGSADRILVEKAARRLTLFRDGEALRSYRIALGTDPVGTKERQGDGRTPEGTYTVSRVRSRKFGEALHISYPNGEDAGRAARRGVSPGGEILIHAPAEDYRWLGGLHRLLDWTDGCIAVTAGEMEDILRAVPDRTPIEIVP